MVVQHNLGASNASRMLNLTSSSIGKSSEKLSSGYRINRAADDAAGLSISEKMRRQIRGLNQSSTNAGDGISFVQIADGALTEVHEMLQRSNELAVQAANGTLSDSDRQNINAEIVKIKEEINSITARTKFNQIEIFSEEGQKPKLQSIDPTEAQQTAVETLASKIADEYFPNAVEQILSTFGSLGDYINSLAATDRSQYDTTLEIDYIDGVSNTLAYMQASFYISSQAFAPSSLLMMVDEDDFPSLELSESQYEVLESTIAHEVMHGIMDVAFPNRMYETDSDEDFPTWFKEGTAQLTGGGYTTGWNSTLISYASYLSDADDTTMDDAIQTYLSQGGKYTVENRPYGHGYLAAAYASYLAADGDDVTTENLVDGADKIFSAFVNDTTSSFEDVMESVMGITVDELKDAIDSGDTTGFTALPTKMSAVEFVRRLTYESLDGAGSLITSSLSVGGTDILNDTAESDDQPIRITNVETTYSTTETSTTTSNGFKNINLHLGVDADMTNKLEIRLYSMNCEALNIADTNVLTEDSATSAIDEFGYAIRLVSGVRSYFGAMQNRLEHTIKNIDNVAENTDAAESRIRDTDMADEMVKYSKDQILSQAGQAMLSQANSQTDSVLSLLSF